MDADKYLDRDKQAGRQTDTMPTDSRRERDIQADRHTHIHTDNKIKRQRDIQTYIR